MKLDEKDQQSDYNKSWVVYEYPKFLGNAFNSCWDILTKEEGHQLDWQFNP